MVSCYQTRSQCPSILYGVVTGYIPHKEKIGNFLDQLSMEVDKHLPNYDNLLMLGDWNSAVTEEEMSNFCEMYNLDNLIKEPT